MAKKRKRRTTSNSSTTKIKQMNFPIVDASSTYNNSNSSYDSGSDSGSSE